MRQIERGLAPLPGAYAERELAARYRIHSIPMLMLFRDGRIVAQQAGAMNATSLLAWLRQHAAGSAAA